MRRIVCVHLSFILIVLASAGTGYAQDEGALVGFWRFDEGKGNVAEDSSANGLHGEVLGGPDWVDGKVLSALQFDGADDYVEVADILTPPVLTFACWFKKLGSGNGGVPRFHSRGAGPWSLEFGIGNTHQPDKLGFYLAFQDGSTVGWTMVFQPELDRWYHAAITYDGTWIRVYVDGKEVYAGDEAAGKKINEGISRIGCHAAGGDCFEGILDEVLLFDTALSAAGIQSLMTGQWLSVDPLDKLGSTWGTIKSGGVPF